MEYGKALDECNNGLNYQDRTFMVAGYIKDYKLTYDDVASEIDDENPRKTVMDFKENRGYVDNDGYVWIFREKEPSNEKLPWFTVVADDNMVPHLVFNKNTASYDKEAFNISRVGDLSIKNIIDNTTDAPIVYDEDVVQSIARASSTVTPIIEDDDDFLKRIVKKTILAKNVNVKKYGPKVGKAWILNNLINGLNGTTKTGPLTFLQWMELLDCDFKIQIIDNGRDTENPLTHSVLYDSISDSLTTEGDEGDAEKSSLKYVKMV